MTTSPFRRTKIVATLGPSSATGNTLEALLASGVDVVRINSSHGSQETRGGWMDLVKQVRGRHDRHVGLLVDLQGPRIRVGALERPCTLEVGAEIVFAPEDEARPVTEKDREDIEHAVAHDVDFVAVSFVRRAADVEAVRSLVPRHVRLVAKIEKATALAELPRIVQAADAIMVARGDLGVEMPFEQVPLAQKRIIRTATRFGRAVITATQMLESMVHNPRPTRAEASDVANAILDGTDAVMLSAETAAGEYPVLAVEAMARIIREIERADAEDGGRPRGRRASDVRPNGNHASVDDAIAFATCAAAELLKVPLIVCFTRSGFTARKIAAYRPVAPILGFSTEAVTCRQLALVWGVVPELASRVPNYDAMLDAARETLLAKDYARPGDRIVVTAGVPFEVPGTTNLLKVESV